MEKPINSELNINSLLTRRYSPRTFANKEIEKDKLERIYEAVRWTPSSSNEQPWQLLVGIKGKNENYSLIFDSLVEFNQIWAHLAPVLIVMISDSISPKSGAENRAHSYDLGQAAAHLTFQAMEEGLFVHQMGGFEKEMLRSEFNIPERFAIHTVIALGYLGEIESLPENFQKMEKSERVRKSQAEFVFKGEWGK